MPIKSTEVQMQEDRPAMYETVPENLYECTISGISDGERGKYQHPEEKEKVINFEFTISQGTQKGKKLGKQISPVINTGFEGGQASLLYQLIHCVYRGIPKKGFQDIVNSLEGKQVKVLVKNKTSAKGNQYSVVKEFLASEKEQAEVPVVQIEDDGSHVEDMPF